MLIIFRKIRRTLMQKNKVTTYLLYAFGEIILVVIGILLALQVNNWNEERKEIKLEKRFLERLYADLDKDIINISNSYNANDRRQERALFLLASYDSIELIKERPNYFIESIEYAGYTNNPVINDHTFEEIKSSGQLSIIRNDELRMTLMAYYSARESRVQYDFIKQEFQLNYLASQRGILNPIQQMAMGSFESEYEFSQLEALEVYRRMKERTDFKTMLPLTIQSQNRTREVFMAWKNEAKRIKGLIENELDNIK